MLLQGVQSVPEMSLQVLWLVKEPTHWYRWRSKWKSGIGLSAGQLTAIHQHCSDIVHCSLETIETLGGGGARCMIAEIFPPNRAVAT